MGYGSYTERIQEIRTDLLHLTEILSKPTASEHENSKRLAALANSCRKLMDHMDTLLEWATHPDISLAERIFLANCRIEELAQQNLSLRTRLDEANGRLTETIKAKDTEIEDWVGKLGIMRAERDREKKKVVELKAELEVRGATRVDPSAVYGKGIKPLKKR